MQATYTYKPVTELDDLLEIVDLQLNVWGEEVVTTLPQLVAAIHNGGVVIGAWIDNELVGFCYGFPGVAKGLKGIHLCSHMMAISAENRNQGIGERLKWEQRQWAIEYGYEKMTWTFDPLEIRNGYLNLVKLGGHVQTYIPSYYGEMGDKINEGLPSDRFLVEWDLKSSKVQQASLGDKNPPSFWNDYKRILDFRKVEDKIIPLHLKVIEENEKGYLLPVPKDCQKLKVSYPELVYQWRMTVRKLTNKLLGKGYTVVGVLRGEDVGYYVLESKREV
ncbi:GNAT family N-acetyltransferase [Thalassobacillus devorans]|uniref:GNAT family N-acetyltransferase n=1 Tax=Thalassobacillus devorans TaxID=279813 RepID=UPI000A1CE058|nr:GNAT family N-acetyltransferase [Thalassobacillus devorans]